MPGPLREAPQGIRHAWLALRILGAVVTVPMGARLAVFPEATAMLLLDGYDSPIANSIVLSCAAPEYAPAGQALVSTSMVHGSG